MTYLTLSFYTDLQEAIKWLTLKWLNVTAAYADAICEATESTSNAAAVKLLNDFQVQKYL